MNIEALACSTPVITFDSGGSPECVAPDCGAVVPAGDIDAMEREILRRTAEHRAERVLSSLRKRAACGNTCGFIGTRPPEG